MMAGPRDHDAPEIVSIDLVNEHCRARILSLGATIAELHVRDKNGKFGDVLLGFAKDTDYRSDKNPCMNCVIGRTAGRTAAPGITVDDKFYALPGCDGGGGGIKPTTHLHGGMTWNRANWTVVVPSPERTGKGNVDQSSVTLEHLDPPGPYPGSVRCTVTYTLHRNSLRIFYEATTTETTPLSVTNHAYWNLSSGADPTVDGHFLQLFCDAFSATDPSGDGIPTGECVSVENTARDLRAEPRELKTVIADQATLSGGVWPHGEEFLVAANAKTNWNESAAEAAAHTNLPPLAAVLTHPPSGRVMRTYTSEPCLQTYYSTLLGLAGLDGKPRGGGEPEPYANFAGVCLEAQRHANAENIPDLFQSRLLRPGEVYRQVTVHVFEVEEEKCSEKK